MADTVVVSQLGARMHYAVPRIFAEAGRLEHVYTDICATQGWPRMLRSVSARFQPSSVRRLAGRVPHGIPQEQLTSFTNFGLMWAIKRMRARTPSEFTAVSLWGGTRFSELVVRCGFGNAAGLYAFSGKSLEQLAAARSQGLWTAVEQIIAPRAMVDRLLAEEEDRFPGWQKRASEDRFAEEFAKREQAEWAAADAIVCPSEFVMQSVVAAGGDPKRCVLVPYGVDGRYSIPRSGRRSGPLRVLTVGAVGLRKGSPYVLEVARRTRGRVEVRMVGDCGVLPRARVELASAVELFGGVPRSEILTHYAWADVFLLPSICEGSATVTYEALAAGLPVVTTPNAGSVIRDGIEGFIIAVRDTDRMVDALDRLASDADLLFLMSSKAAARAGEFDLHRYGQRLQAALKTAANRELEPVVH